MKNKYQRIFNNKKKKTKNKKDCCHRARKKCYISNSKHLKQELTAEVFLNFREARVRQCKKMKW